MNVIEVDETLPLGKVTILAICLDLKGERFHFWQPIDVFRPEILFAQLGRSILMLLRLAERMEWENHGVAVALPRNQVLHHSFP